ncbi:MAG: PilW family protein [Nitrospiraceae bacterium]
MNKRMNGRPSRHTQTQIALDKRGFTLVEVMIAALVTSVIVGAGFGVLVASEKATRTSGQIVDAQQSARLAMELLARDIKLAGYGWQANVNVGNCQVPVALPNTAAPIVPVETNPAGPDTGPDGIRLIVPMTNTQVAGGAAWQLAAPTIPGFSTIQLQNGAVAAMQTAGLLNTTTAISINGSYSAQVIGVNGANLQLAMSANEHISFPAGAQVYLLQCVNYTVANTQALCGNIGAPCLLRGPVGPNGAPNLQVAIADGIEDIQFAYACDGCTVANPNPDGIIDNQDGVAGFSAGDFITNAPWNLSPVTPTKIRLVQINLVARQTARGADQGVGEGNVTALLTPNPLQISDHNHVNGVFAAGDFGVQTPPYTSVRRRVLTRTVDARNAALCDVC